LPDFLVRRLLVHQRGDTRNRHQWSAQVVADDAEKLVAGGDAACRVRVVPPFLDEQPLDVFDGLVRMLPFVRKILVGRLTLLPQCPPLLAKFPCELGLDRVPFVFDEPIGGFPFVSKDLIGVLSFLRKRGRDVRDAFRDLRGSL